MSDRPGRVRGEANVRLHSPRGPARIGLAALVLAAHAVLLLGLGQALQRTAGGPDRQPAAAPRISWLQLLPAPGRPPADPAPRVPGSPATPPAAGPVTAVSARPAAAPGRSGPAAAQAETPALQVPAAAALPPSPAVAGDSRADDESGRVAVPSPGPSPAAAASAPSPGGGPWLDTPGSRRAIREAARRESLAEQHARATEAPVPASVDDRLGAAIALGARGDCLKGEYAGGGMGLLSLPFWIAAEVRGRCRR